MSVRKTTKPALIKSELNISTSQQKFKPLKIAYNQLQSKYDIIKNGTPNVYEQNVDALKVYSIKNEINLLEMPAIDYLLQDIRNTPKDIGANNRNYDVHPSATQKYGNKFRTLISDRQEIKDFMDWFMSKEREIENRNCPTSKKFHLKQTLIAAGFHQILTQICNISRPRSEVLKMLWNKQNEEAGHIIGILHKQNSDQEKKNLETIKNLHLDYQEQILQLKSESYCIEKKLQEASILNEGCINTLRSIKKEKKKYEKIIKQLLQSNFLLKNQSLNLMEENTKLLMKEKNLSKEHARVLSYRMIQLQAMRRQGASKISVRDIMRRIKNEAEKCVDTFDLPDLDEKKEKLIDFIKKRMEENPDQKRFIMKGEFSDEEDENLLLEDRIEEIINAKEVRAQLQSQIFVPASFMIDHCTSTEDLLPEIQTDSQCIQTDPIQLQLSKKDLETEKLLNLESLFYLHPDEDEQELLKLKEKKTKVRHSLIMIEMNRTMEFRKLDTASKVRRVSKNSNAHQGKHQRNPSNMTIMSGNNRATLESQEATSKNQLPTSNFRQSQSIEGTQHEAQTLRKIRQSSFIQKSSQFQSLIKGFSNFRAESFAQYSEEQDDEVPMRIGNKANKLQEFRDVACKYLKNQKVKNNKVNTNPEKALKKILTDTFKNLYICNKTNMLSELINSAKNCFGNLTYENRLLQHINTIMYYKESKSLLAALSILLNIPETEPEYGPIIDQDVCELYFKTYFTLTLKNPIQIQFNIWSNYTNLNKISSQSLSILLKEFFNNNKCEYLHLKIKEFIGIDSHESLQGNYYVEINSLMMYILEVYLLEKRNYYDSYSELIDFLANGDWLDLDSLIFLLDLLCFEEDEQKKIISSLFRETPSAKDRRREEGLQYVPSHCKKDHFYRLCIKYELPLFELVRILKSQQFKKLHQHIQNQYMEINAVGKWNDVKQQLQCKLRSRAKYTTSFAKIITKLDHYIKSNQYKYNNAFSFLYRIVVHTAFF